MLKSCTLILWKMHRIACITKIYQNRVTN
uniref:Uncharacterized protein n=1 Tax=Arundo donax TaxID=35708 RepID=A0A0A9HK08_ARUDO